MDYADADSPTNYPKRGSDFSSNFLPITQFPPVPFCTFDLKHFISKCSWNKDSNYTEHPNLIGTISALLNLIFLSRRHLKLNTQWCWIILSRRDLVSKSDRTKIVGRREYETEPVSRLSECENPNVVRFQRIRLEIPLATREHKWRVVYIPTGNEMAIDSREMTTGPFPASPDPVTFEGASISRVCESFLRAR